MRTACVSATCCDPDPGCRHTRCRYAEGDSEDAKKFNCVQRGHQQALESWPSFLACSLLGGLSYPLTTALFGVSWCYARLEWAEGYAESVERRYKGTGRMIWYSWLGVMTTASATAIFMLSDIKK
jgi:hypothetical protein